MSNKERRFFMEDMIYPDFMANKHYIKIREDGAIIDGWSDGLFPSKDTVDAICINENAGYQFRLVFHVPRFISVLDGDDDISTVYTGQEQEIVEELSEENPQLFDFSTFIPLYKYVNGEIVKRTQAEMDVDRKTMPPYLEDVKKEKQEENKKALAKFLAEHPLKWTDGKYYGVTEDDQREMSLNLMQYQLAVGAGQESATLEWHSQKTACTSWSLENFTALALAITNYVYPYLRYQESVKETIYTCKTKEEVASIVIDYESVNS